MIGSTTIGATIVGSIANNAGGALCKCWSSYTELSLFARVPEMCEYMNRDIFDVAAKYGKDVFLSTKHLGTKRLPMACALKSAVEYQLNKIPFLPKVLPDIFLCLVSHSSRTICQSHSTYVL